MDAARKRALRRYNHELRTGFIVNNLLPDLHCDAGGFLTDVESLTISSKSCNVTQVDELIVILLTKENRDFDSFCRVLKKGGCLRWSEKLNQSVSPTKQGAPGGAECPVPCPLIHSIKDDYLKVKDVFCDSPGMPSLDALKDRCDDLIHVAFADEPEISHHESTIRKVETVRELARILFFRLSRWISFDFLDKVVEHFQPELKDVKERLAQYKEKLRLILMQKLKQISELRRQRQEEMSEGLELAEIVAKYRLDADGLRVQDLVTERDFMAQRLGIPEYLLQVLSWRPGSVVIVFLLLQELRPLVELALRRSDVRAGLISRGVQAIYFDGCSSNLVDRASEHQPRTLDSSLSHPGSLVTPSAVESNLKANFEQYSYSHEDSGNQVKELIEEKQKLAEIARDATAKLAVLEQQRLSYDAVSAPPRPPPTTSEAAGRSVGEEATGVSAQTPIDPSKLVNFLPAMATKWFDIGLKLGCKDTAMELRTSTEPPQTRCFMIIDEWMNKEGESACWEYLCRDILRSEGVGLGDVADRIEQELGLESSRQMSSQACGSRGLLQRGRKGIMSTPPDSLIFPLEESGKRITSPTSPMQPRSFLSRLFNRRRSAEDSTDVMAYSPLGGEARDEVESRLKQEVQGLRSRVKELEEDCEQMAACKQRVVEELMAKCTAEEERRRKAEDLRERADEARRQAEEGRRRAEEGRRRAEEACRLAEEGRKRVEEDWRQSEKGKKKAKEIESLRREVDYLRLLAFSPDIASLEMKNVLPCRDRDVQNHLKTLYDNLDTSPMHLTDTPGSPYRDWRCLAEYVGVQEADLPLHATNCKRRLSVIFDEWAKKESVTVAKVHKVLTDSQCTVAAECLLLAAKSVVEQEDRDVFLDLGSEAIVQSC